MAPLLFEPNRTQMKVCVKCWSRRKVPAHLETQRLTINGIRFVRVGTLDNPDLLPPDIHIFTESKQPWVELPRNIPAVPEYYDLKAYWPKASLERLRILRAGS